MAGGEQQRVANKAAAAVAGSGGGSRRFAVTCGLLRQYMKEHGGSNGSAGRLLPAVTTTVNLMTGAGDAVPAEEAAPVEMTTMELFPQQAGTLKTSEERKEMTENKAQLTIFYGGSVVVFDDFPAEKVGELMNLAGSGETAAVSADAAAAAACQPCLPDMPIARKVSLQRFLEKRKNRLTVTEPLVPVDSSPESEKKEEESSKRVKKGNDGAAWLGVNPTLSL